MPCRLKEKRDQFLLKMSDRTKLCPCWWTQEGTEARGITTVTSAGRCHGRCLKAHPRTWQCFHVHHQTLQFLSTWRCASCGAITVTEIRIASVQVHGNVPMQWNLVICIIICLEDPVFIFGLCHPGLSQTILKNHWILSSTGTIPSKKFGCNTPAYEDKSLTVWTWPNWVTKYQRHVIIGPSTAYWCRCSQWTIPCINLDYLDQFIHGEELSQCQQASLFWLAFIIFFAPQKHLKWYCIYLLQQYLL